MRNPNRNVNYAIFIFDGFCHKTGDVLVVLVTGCFFCAETIFNKPVVSSRDRVVNIDDRFRKAIFRFLLIYAFV